MTDIFKDGLWQDAGEALSADDIETLYTAFLTRLLSETSLRMWPNRNLDCQGVTGEKGKTEI